MKKRSWIKYLIIIAVVLVIAWYPTGYYCMFPGEALNLNEVITGGKYEPETSFHMTTVTMVRANLPILIYGKLNSSARVLPEKSVIPQGWDVEEYNQYNKYQMQNSHNNAKQASANWLNVPYSIQEGHVKAIRVIENSPANNVLQSQDIILSINGVSFNSVSKAIETLTTHKPNDKVSMIIERNGEQKELDIVLGKHPDDETRAFLGVTLINEDRKIDFTGDNKITIETGNISGPSAGLMMTMEIINKMIETDITSGKQIAGTGTIDGSGKVGKIGGINQKLIAAHKKGIEIFFVPKDNVEEITLPESKYEGMTLVTVETLQDALDYLINNERVAHILPIVA